MKTHPFAENFPLMRASEIQELADDILENGLRENIIVTSDHTVLVDGRNRLRACGVVGVAPRFSYLAEGTTEAEILRLIVSANIKTRSLTPGQLAMIGYSLMQEIKMVPAVDLVNYPPIRPYDNNTPRSYAAVVVGVSSKTIWQANIIADYSPVMEDKVRSGEMTLNGAYERVMNDRGLRPGPKRIKSDLPKRPPSSHNNTRDAVEGRRAWLRHLAGQKLTAQEISIRLDISEEHVRRLARRHNIGLPGDAWSYKRRKPNFDVNRVAQVVADDLMAMIESLPRIRDNLDQIESEKANEWARIYWRASRQLNQLAKSLNQMSPTNRTNKEDDHSA